VVLPRTVEAGAAAVAVCRKHGVPLLSRGGGTSLAGQCTNTAVVIDWSKYCHRVLEVDELKPAGLRFGPEPATHMNCTIGRVIGNNSCGATAQRTGKVVDNVEALEVLLYDGTRFWCGRTSVVLWPDTFSNHFHLHVGQAAAAGGVAAAALGAAAAMWAFARRRS
jgi:FAD/FMN-containing dehydrogenase